MDTTDAAAKLTDRLCRQWGKLAVKFIAPTIRSFPSLEPELLSAANYALFTAARGYAGKDAKFRAAMPWVVWLKICIVHKARMVLARERTWRKINAKPIARPDLLADDAAAPDVEAEEREELERTLTLAAELLSLLTDEERTRVMRYYGERYGVLSRMAREESVTPSTVQKRINRSLTKLRVEAMIAAGNEGQGDG